jgi:hypothetical protein
MTIGDIDAAYRRAVQLHLDQIKKEIGALEFTLQAWTNRTTELEKEQEIKS